MSRAVGKGTKRQSKALWAVVSLVIAVASVAAVIWQSRAFKLEHFFNFVCSANPGFIAAAVFCMLCYIFFEGAALRVILKAFGNSASVVNCTAYSATDIYFSAITPSATGGQPASAIMMMRDNIPGSTATVALLANIVMYTSSILVLGVLAIIFYPTAFSCFSPASHIMIYVGVFAQSCLLAFFVLLLLNENLLRKIADALLKLCGKLHIIRKVEEKEAKLNSSLDNYARDVRALRGQGKMLFRVFLLNVAQRTAQIAVTAFVHLASGGRVGDAIRIFALQCYVVLGASYMPIPGAMGVTDFLMLDAFEGTGIMTEEAATSLELLSRTLSFYCCIALCALIVLLRFLSSKKTRSSK